MIAYKLQFMVTRLLKRILFLVVFISFGFCIYSCANLLRINETAAEKHFIEGKNQLKNGEKGQAIRSFRTAIQKYKKFSKAYFELAKIYLAENSINNIILADWALQQAVRYHPENIEYRLNLANLYLKREFYHSAENEFKQIIRRDSTNAEAWYALGYIHELELMRLQNLITPDSSGQIIYFTSFAKEELEKTKHFYKKSIESNPSYLPAYYRLGFVFYELQDWQTMIRLLQKALDVDSENKRSHLYLALAYHRNNQFELASDEYQIAWEKMSAEERNFYSSIEPLLSQNEKNIFLAKTKGKQIQFVTSFWQSKDPMLLTDFNERLMEHFSRIAYANLRFGFPHKNIEGWQTDRGKVYIRFGPPENQIRTTASFKKTEPGDRNPLVSSKITWNYPGFQFVFEDQFLHQNYQFKWGTEADDYLDIFNRTIKKTPDYYQPDFGGKIFELPVITRQFDTSDSLRTIYIYSGIPIENVDRRYYVQQNRIEADLQKGIFVFDHLWSPISKTKKNVTFQFLSDLKFNDSFFLSVDSLKLPAAKYNFAVEFFDPHGKNLVKHRNTLEVSAAKKGSMELSDIILANDIRLKTGISQINRTKIEVNPNFNNSFMPGQDIFLYYEIYNLTKRGEKTKYQISHIIRRLDSNNSMVSNLLSRLKLQKKTMPEVTTTFTYEGDKTKENNYRILRLKDYEAGEYQLIVRIEDINTNKTAEKYLNFRIKE